MIKEKLGRLEKVDLREIWEKEDTHFTPWLAREENIELLGSAIDMDLVVEAEEKDVGPFRADILCKDMATNNWVLVENQLERTDHKHLGQLLTYATGLDAVTIIWVASEFTEEHRATLDWLNKITDPQYNFFGIKVELFKIGDSRVAPVFNVVSKPNNWSRSISSAASKLANEDVGETKLLQFKFWSTINDAIKSKNDSPLKVQKPSPKHWHVFSIGKSGVALSMTFNSKENLLGIELYIAKDQSIYESLEKDKDEIEKEIGQKLSWQPLPGRSASRIKLYRNNSILDNESEWSSYIDWSIEYLEKFYHTFKEKLKNID
jgi:hypothetical protein